MQLNEEIRKQIMNHDDASVLALSAKKNGMTTLREDGWNKVAQGVTTIDEVMRVTQEF